MPTLIETKSWKKSSKPIKGCLNLDELIDERITLNKDIYHIILTQTSTNNPVVTVLESTISGIVVTRSDVGTYLFTKIGAFPTGKYSPAAATVGYTLAGDKLVLTPVLNVFHN